MDSYPKSLSEALLPTAIRPFFTFRSSSYLACGIFVLSSLLRFSVRLSPRTAIEFATQDQLIRSPKFLIGYNCAVALVLVAMYATRRYERIYYPRVFVFAMFLAGLAAELAALLFPWHVA